MLPVVLLLAASTAAAVDLPAGQIVDRVECVKDASQTYALYLPSSYTPDRAWPVIFLFDAGGRGRTGVERYQAAAEQYGYILAGSNNSRNGQASLPAVTAMTGDVFARLKVDMKRVYTAGMSGGARVAMGVAISTPTKVAGVLASSASYPDGQMRKTLPFPVFATAGTEDFNHGEMREFDAALTTPHHLAFFEGGHQWLSNELALEGVEWMEVQAMKSGIRPRDTKEIDQIFAKRELAAGALQGKDAYLALKSLVEDFGGLKDVSALKARESALGRDKAVVAGLKADRDEDDRERRMLGEVWSAEARLVVGSQHSAAMSELSRRWRELSEQANASADTPERRLNRRVLALLSASVMSDDEEYLDMIRPYRNRGRGGR